MIDEIEHVDSLSNTEEKNKESKVEGGKRQFRLVLGKSDIDALDAFLLVVNEGFHVGRVSRTQAAGFLFKNAKRFLSKSDLAKLREECFDEKVALEVLLKESEESGELPEALRKLLKDRFKNG